MPTPDLTLQQPLKPLSHVLVAVSLEPRDEWALRRALALPLAPGGRITALHVVEPPQVRSLAALAQDDTDEAARLRDAKTKLAAAIKAAKPSWIKTPSIVEAEVVLGEPASEIMALARARNVDLVVLGRQARRRTLRGAVMGSTAERVTRQGKRPLIVVARNPTGSYAHALVTVDLDKHFKSRVEAAGEASCALAKRILGAGAKVTLFHAYNVPFEGFITPAYASGNRGEFGQAIRDEAQTVLNALRAHARTLSLDADLLLEEGDARARIIEAAQTLDADLIVVRTHGRSALTRLLIGSVAAWVVAAAGCDVLIDRAP